MVKVTNRLENIPATQAYVDFGLEQVENINNRFKLWLDKQSFTDNVSEFGELSVGGIVDDVEYTDKIEWDLIFSDKSNNRSLDDSLLHEKRYPDITTFNSKPQIFDTVNYIKIMVSNNERGWINEGSFPLNVYISKDYDVEPRIDQPMPEIAVQTDIKREALAGFEAAFEWQKYRAMAIASSNFVEEQIINGVKKVEIKDNKFQHNIRSRRESVYNLLVQLLPDTRLDEEESTGLKSYYKPGILEGTLALELDNLMAHPNDLHEENSFTDRPILGAKGQPIEIITTTEGYDALIRLDIKTYSSLRGDEELNSEVEEQLNTYFNVKLKKDRDRHMEFVLELKNAHLIEKEIIRGETDTPIHKFTKNLGDTLRTLHRISNDWREEINSLESGYEMALREKRITYFSPLKEKLSNLE